MWLQMLLTLLATRLVLVEASDQMAWTEWWLALLVFTQSCLVCLLSVCAYRMYMRGVVSPPAEQDEETAGSIDAASLPVQLARPLQHSPHQTANENSVVLPAPPAVTDTKIGKKGAQGGVDVRNLIPTPARGRTRTQTPLKGGDPKARNGEYSSIPAISLGENLQALPRGLSGDISPQPSRQPPGALMGCNPCSRSNCQQKARQDSGLFGLLEAWLPGAICCRPHQRPPAVVLEAPTFCSATFERDP